MCISCSPEILSLTNTRLHTLPNGDSAITNSVNDHSRSLYEPQSNVRRSFLLRRFWRAVQLGIWSSLHNINKLQHHERTSNDLRQYHTLSQRATHSLPSGSLSARRPLESRTASCSRRRIWQRTWSHCHPYRPRKRRLALLLPDARPEHQQHRPGYHEPYS